MNIKRIVYLVLIFTISSIYSQSFETNRFSFYSDIKAHSVGDVVMVLIAETANASQESKINSSSKSNVSADGSVSGNLAGFLPLFGASGNLSNSNNGSQGTLQKEKLTGKLSTTIMEILDNGMYRIEGERTIEVNGEKNIMRLEGLVRSRDIQSNNTIFSYNIADTKIIYRKNDLAGKMIKPGSMQKWSTKIFTLALVAIAFIGVST